MSGGRFVLFHNRKNPLICGLTICRIGINFHSDPWKISSWKLQQLCSKQFQLQIVRPTIGEIELKKIFKKHLIRPNQLVRR